MAEHLTERFVKAMTPPEKGHIIVWDNQIRGFGVRITSTGTIAFILNYRFDDPSDTRRRSSEYRYTIGQFGPRAWTVAAARVEAGEWRKKIDRGETHPMAERRRRRESTKASREAETFKQAVEDYIKREQEGRRKNATAGEIKRAILKGCADWHDDPIVTIQAADIRSLLEAVRDGDGKKIAPRPYLANRLYAYLKTFFAWCAEPGVDKVTRSPMDGLKRPWDGEESRERTYTDDELRAIWKAADTIGGTRGAFVKVLALTGKRKTALAAMRWNEIDDNGLWKPPVDPRRRRRIKRVHVTPLPRLAVRIVRGLTVIEGNPYVFAGRHKGKRIDPGTPLKNEIKAKSNVDDFTFHALRHTLETRFAELKISPHIRDLLLDHAPVRGAGAGYDHHHYGDEMREALERWADHIEALVSRPGVKVLR
jgi:integrase